MPERKVGLAKNEEELGKMMEQVYGNNTMQRMNHPIQFLNSSAMISFDDEGKLIAPETRQCKCRCGNNIILFLVEAPTQEEYKQGKIPIWAGYCTKCKSGHVRYDKVAKLPDQLYQHYLELGHKRMRDYIHRRHRR